VAPQARVVAVVAIAEVAICLNQMFGDMGFSGGTTLTILATALAAAGRLTASSGAWPTTAGRVETRARGADFERKRALDS
jgi:hypothetical protein